MIILSSMLILQIIVIVLLIIDIRKQELKMKNKILKTISNIALVMMMIFICSMDSPNIIIPIVGMIVCGAWLILFYTVNEDKLEDEWR